MSEITECPHCKGKAFNRMVLDHGPHYGRIDCNMCGRWLAWIAKPDSEKKARRENSHRELVKKYSRGYCEICGILELHLPRNEALEAHHVEEYRARGRPERENLWILCTRHHRLVHHERTHTRHFLEEKCHEFGEDPAGPEES